MKFVKENLILVICGAVVLLALVSVWYPTLTWQSSYAADRGGWYKDQTNSADTKTNTQLVLPGIPAAPATTGPATAPSDTKLRGVPTPNITADKAEANSQMKIQSAKVIQQGAQANRAGRINTEGVPLLAGNRQRGYLPKMSPASDPEEFKKEYKAQYDNWLNMLAGKGHGATTPPNAEEITAAWAAKQAKLQAAAPAGLQPVLGQPDNKEQNEFTRNLIMLRAGGTHMYVDLPSDVQVNAATISAFQRRSWAAEQAPPGEQEIFEALVDSWFQNDVVTAIAAVNDAELAKVTDASKRNVGAAPIKRLMKISVGNPDANTPRLTGAQGGLGGGLGGAPPAGQAGTIGLWYMPGTAAAVAAPTDAPIQAAGASGANTIDYSRTLTGRAGGTDYDVVQMQIWMDIDPTYLNKFIENLYKQNMGYTVLQIKFKTVDPLDRASNGFIYGENQVIEVEILVEGLLFRNWTVPLMPPAVMTAVGAVVPAPCRPAQLKATQVRNSV